MTGPHHGIGSSRNASGYIFLSDWDPKCDTPAFHQSPTLADCLRTCSCTIPLYVVSQSEKPRALDSVKQTSPLSSRPLTSICLKKTTGRWWYRLKRNKETKEARSVVASISAVAILFYFILPVVFHSRLTSQEGSRPSRLVSDRRRRNRSRVKCWHITAHIGNRYGLEWREFSGLQRPLPEAVGNVSGVHVGISIWKRI